MPPTPPPTTCILLSRYRPARRRPPRARASHAHHTRAPRPWPPAEKPTLVREAAYRSRSRYVSAGRSAGTGLCQAMGSTISSDTPAAAQ